MSRLPAPLLAALSSASVLLAACGQPWPEEGIDPTNPAKLAIGQEIYVEHCAACHGANLQGQPDWRQRRADGRLPAPPHDASGHTWHHSDAELFAMVHDGLVPPLAPEGYQSDMPAYGDILSDDEIRAVLAFIQSKWPAEVVSMRNRMLAQREPAP